MKVDPGHISEIMGRFKNQDPRLFDQYLRVLDAYVQDVTAAVTEAAPGEILQYQGRAQQAIKFYRLCAETKDPKEPTP